MVGRLPQRHLRRVKTRRARLLFDMRMVLRPYQHTRVCLHMNQYHSVPEALHKVRMAAPRITSTQQLGGRDPPMGQSRMEGQALLRVVREDQDMRGQPARRQGRLNWDLAM